MPVRHVLAGTDAKPQAHRVISHQREAMTLTVTVFRSEGVAMVHDRIAEELEAKGFYRRAAARWGEVMLLVETDKERHQVTMRRLECSRKAQKPPEPPDNFGDLRKAVDRTYAEMGIDGVSDEIWRNYPDS
ncbi:hypothetical protein OkiPb00406_42230 [Escherichia coli]